MGLGLRVWVRVRVTYLERGEVDPQVVGVEEAARVRVRGRVRGRVRVGVGVGGRVQLLLGLGLGVGLGLPMLGDVLEGLLVLLGALRALPQQQPLRAWEVKTAWLGLGLGLRLGLGLGVLTVSQVAALLVRLGALGTLHGERRLAARKPSEQLQVHGSAEVVGVGDEHVFESLRDERVQRARAHLGRVRG